MNVPTQSPPLQGSRALSRPSGPCLSHDGDLPSIGTIRGSTMTNCPADLASTMRSSSAWQGTSPAPDRWSRQGEALLARVPDVKEVIGSPRPSHLSGQGSGGGAMRSSRREGQEGRNRDFLFLRINRSRLISARQYRLLSKRRERGISLLKGRLARPPDGGGRNSRPVWLGGVEGQAPVGI